MYEVEGPVWQCMHMASGNPGNKSKCNHMGGVHHGNLSVILNIEPNKILS